MVKEAEPGLYRAGHIWHKSARMGKILNPCRNFDIFSTSVQIKWFLCRGKLAVPGQKSQGKSKNVILSVDPTWMTR